MAAPAVNGLLLAPQETVTIGKLRHPYSDFSNQTPVSLMPSRQGTRCKSSKPRLSHPGMSLEEPRVCILQ